MPEYLLKEADLDLLGRYQEEAEGAIRYITVSPEVKGIPEAIPQIREMGITVAIGHSGADYETASGRVPKRVRILLTPWGCSTSTVRA